MIEPDLNIKSMEKSTKRTLQVGLRLFRT